LKYDVFISYRRKSGAIKAELLKAVLRQRGFQEDRIFFDTYSLGAGNYVRDLQQAIKDSKNIIVLITKDCFEDLSDTSNWILELSTAISQGKNIVPMYFDDITEIPVEVLPAKVKDLPLANAVIYSPHYTRASYDKLCSFLQPDKENIRRKVLAIAGISLASIILLAGLFFGGKAGIKAIQAHKNVVIEEEPVKGLVVSNEPVLVDLGLPSGTLWLDRNIGAEHFYDYGEYYAFWETYTKTDFKKGSNITERYKEIKEDLLMRKDYDIAFVKSDGQWILPTEAQLNELISLCEWTEAEYEGISGRLVTGPSGYAIFLPAAGMKVNKNLQYAGEYGYYWSGDLADGYSTDRYGRELLFAPNQSVGNGYTYCGRSVRPVGKKR